MKRDHFLARVRQFAGLHTRAEGESAMHAVFAALHDTLSTSEIDRLAAQLPNWLAGMLHASCGHKRVSFFDEVATEEGIEIGFAREHAGVVLQALDEELTPEGKVYLRQILPSELATLLIRRSASATPPRQRQGSTLASGRPGSRHPVSEARLDRAHGQSVARTDDPHRDTKLSESHGATQERLDETLAEGHPGPKRPLSGGGT